MTTQAAAVAAVAAVMVVATGVLVRAVTSISQSPLRLRTRRRLVLALALTVGVAVALRRSPLPQLGPLPGRTLPGQVVLDLAPLPAPGSQWMARLTVKVGRAEERR